MKQKVLFSLMLLCMSLCSISSWAELVRPTMPEATLESGKSYYLYNVEADLFAKKDGGYLRVNETPSAIEITQMDNGTFTMKTEGNYLEAYLSDGQISFYKTYYQYDSWSIISVDDSYLIQCSQQNSSYNADQYLGWMGDNATEIRYNQPVTGAVHWKLIHADDEGNRYVAALKLYKELEKAEVFVENGYSVELFKYYTDLYVSRATADINEMTDAAIRLRGGLSASQGYKAPYWNERPILFGCSEGTFNQDNRRSWALNSNNFCEFSRELYYNGNASTLMATVMIEEPSAFIYSLDGYTLKDDNNIKVKVYVDDVMVRELCGQQCIYYSHIYPRFVEDLTPGCHTVKWVMQGNANDFIRLYVKNVGVMSSPLISVNLLEPGSLGTEVLYNTDHIKNVRRLKIKGEMNNDDWAKIKMMHYLQDLDLSEAVITEIPNNQFNVAADSSSNFLHRMKLPEGLNIIREYAFNGSFIDELELPSTLSTLERNVFMYSHIQHLDMPENLTNIDVENCYRMCWLKSVRCPKNLTFLPERMFYNCTFIENMVLPDSLITIADNVFRECNRMKIESFPDNLATIGNQAFRGCHSQSPKLNSKLRRIGTEAFSWNLALKSVVLPESVEYIGNNAFQGCYGLEEITISSPIWSIPDNMLKTCTNLNTLRLNTPTVAGYNTNSSLYPVDATHISNVNLIVPEHLVTSYKLDSYWYNFKSIQGFNTEEIQYWRINNPLVLNRERFAGNPDIVIVGNYDRMPSLKINGDNQQNINNLYCFGNSKDYNSYAGQILCNSKNVVINGKVNIDLETQDKRWHFFCLPYDIKVSEITSGDPTTQKAIRYYNGANRAQNGVAGSWKNFGEDDVIPAGTGFIMQTNKFAWSRFYSFNETKQNIVATTEFVKTLEVNDSETAANKGWNLVGNPWQCFFNNHYLNFNGPITVWDTYNRTYKAYSLTDDDYAIRPNEAFFVQCPNEEYNTISFPAEGRQLTAEIVNQNPAQVVMREGTAKANMRKLVDVVISDGDLNDQTRIVLNENASADYELSCDAGKMMSMDQEVPQIYTLDNGGIQYSINERPVSDGVINLGFYAGKSGKYTFKLSRSMVETVILVDHMTGKETDIRNSEYTFTSEAGTDNARFSLKFNPAETTGIKTVQSETSDDIMYNLSGQRISKPVKGIMIRGGKKIIIK